MTAGRALVPEELLEDLFYASKESLIEAEALLKSTKNNLSDAKCTEKFTSKFAQQLVDPDRHTDEEKNSIMVVPIDMGAKSVLEFLEKNTDEEKKKAVVERKKSDVKEKLKEAEIELDEEGIETEYADEIEVSVMDYPEILGPEKAVYACVLAREAFQKLVEDKKAELKKEGKSEEQIKEELESAFPSEMTLEEWSQILSGDPDEEEDAFEGMTAEEMKALGLSAEDIAALENEGDSDDDEDEDAEEPPAKKAKTE